MYLIFGLLSMVSAALLILLVLVQNSKGGGLSSTFGASNLSSMIGNRRATQDVEKFTWYLAFGMMAISFIANVSVGGNVQAAGDSFGTLDTAPPPAAAPAAPSAPGAMPNGGATNGGGAPAQ